MRLLQMLTFAALLSGLASLASGCPETAEVCGPDFVLMGDRCVSTDGGFVFPDAGPVADSSVASDAGL